jgi:uncharacterized protein YbjT (DUF2867 family)
VSSTILLLGSRGFIGRYVLHALEAAGHHVRRADRPESDLARDTDPARWQARLQGVDVVVNAAGIFRENAGQTFQAVHVEGPAALFDACARAGARVVQISALGADERASSAFHRSKLEGDERLLALDVRSLVLQPSLVYGAGGTSAALFTRLAALPWIPTPGRGDQRVQPVRVEDVAAAVTVAIARDHFPRARLAVVGPEPLTLRVFLARIRASLGLPAARFVPIPRALVVLAARSSLGLLDRESLAMLERGNVAEVAPMRALLGRDPQPVPAPMDAPLREAMRTRAQLAWLLVLLRASLAAVWITAGVVSLGFYPVADSLALLASTGLTGKAAYVALYGAALLDMILGVATLAMPRQRMLWLVQIALIVAYSAIITACLPEQWLHPYGPVVKNLPILAALVLLYTLEER